ncbi:MAG TPA: CotH kinase family protein [Archangium sp.]|uniref:CotH kinase family protein n=1 Tax=Archangium sp. TaxID=1872627 RepID=UPI002ED95A7B
MRRRTWLMAVALVGALACGPGGVDVTASAPSSQQPAQRQPDPMDPDETPESPATPDAGTPDAGPRSFPPVQTRVPTFSLSVAPEDLAKLEAEPESDARVPVVVELDGVRAPGLMRYRGASTRTVPQKSFKIELDPGYELEDRDHFELLACWFDGGKLTEKFAVDLYAALGLPVPRARYTRVSLNGKPNGLYLDMEHVGKDYLKHHAMERQASIYRCGGRNCELTLSPGPYQDDFEKKTNEDTGWEDLRAFLTGVNRSDDAVLESWLSAHVNLEAYLGNLAADALISNSIVEDSRSYWVHELQSDVWTYVPWDLNNARMLYWRTWEADQLPPTQHAAAVFTAYDPWVQRVWEQRVTQYPTQRPTWSVLATRVWERPALRERVLAKLEAALAGPFSEEQAWAHIDALWRVVGPELEKDPYVSKEHAARARGYLKSYVRGRRAWLHGQLTTLRAHGTGTLVIREVSAGSRGYVEVLNRGTQERSLTGYVVTDDLRAPGKYRLPPLVLKPGQTLRLIADGNTEAGPTHLPFTLSRAGGEVGLFDGTRVYGPLDTVYYGPLLSGTVYSRRGTWSDDFERRTVQ